MAISIGRLSGGNTPADGSDPRTFPAIWNATADTLEAGVIPTSLTSPSTGQLLQYNGTNWVNVGQAEAGAIPVFADSTARSSAIPTPSEGMITYLEDTDAVEKYDGSAFVNVAPGGLVAVKSAINTGPEVFGSVAAGGNVAVPDLSITHEVSDPANRLIISAFFGVAGESGGRARVGIAVNDGTNFIGVGGAAGNRVRVGAGGFTTFDASSAVVSMPSVTFVHTPGSGSKTYTAQAMNVNTTTATLFINRAGDDSDTTNRSRGASALTIQEVAV